MKVLLRRGLVAVGVFFATPLWITAACQAPAAAGGGETILMVRHGEKPGEHPDGQLDCQGLNRALALPAVLARFGRPLAIYAPNPSVQTTDGDEMPFAPKYSYVRPLMTIEPYAIAMGMPVNTQIAEKDLRTLEQELTKPEYANGLVVVAWEHIQAWKFAEQMLAQYGLDPSLAPNWKNSDYDTIYIFHLTPAGGGKKKLDFHIEQEKLNGLPVGCPAAPVAAKP
jgi:hypothetical protein